MEAVKARDGKVKIDGVSIIDINEEDVLLRTN